MYVTPSSSIVPPNQPEEVVSIRRSEVLAHDRFRLAADLLHRSLLLARVLTERLARVHLVSGTELGRRKQEHTRLAAFDAALELRQIGEKVAPLGDGIAEWIAPRDDR
jgi:hypothetical protein